MCPWEYLEYPGDCEKSSAVEDSDLMNSAFTEDSSQCDNQNTLGERLDKLKNNFDNGSKQKLTVDEDDILNDAMSYLQGH